jgi:competence CoiA-like predicted nuclease
MDKYKELIEAIESGDYKTAKGWTLHLTTEAQKENESKADYYFTCPHCKGKITARYSQGKC